MPLPPLFGHEGVKSKLAGAHASGKLPQALLLAGPRGVGKQRLALWLAQLIQCEAPGQDPCGECRPCRLVLSLQHPDVHWFVPVELSKRGSGSDTDADKQIELVADAMAEEMAARREQPLSAPVVGLASHPVAAVRLLLDSAPSSWSEFQTFVRPRRYPRLSTFCRELTGITQENVDTAPAFPDALRLFLDWLQELDRVVLATWSRYDAWQLELDLEAHGLPKLAIPLLDVKAEVDEAIAAYRQVIRLDPAGAEAHHCLGNAFWTKGKLDDAIADHDGQIVHHDATVAPGRRYGYRLIVATASARETMGETWIDVPAAATLALVDREGLARVRQPLPPARGLDTDLGDLELPDPWSDPMELEVVGLDQQDVGRLLPGLRARFGD